MTVTVPVTVTAVAVGRPRDVPGPGEDRTTSTAIWKDRTAARVAVVGDNLAGDEQADREHHGGPDKAVYAYGTSDLAWWSGEMGRDLDPQTFGQNLTVDGADLRDAVVGERWRVGSAVLEVAQPRIPCFKLGLRADDPTMPRRFTAAGRPGVYLRVVAEGEVGAGDAVIVTDRPAHGVTVGEAFGVYLHRRDAAARLLDAPQLPASWHRWARERLPG